MSAAISAPTPERERPEFKLLNVDYAWIANAFLLASHV